MSRERERRKGKERERKGQSDELQKELKFL